MAPSHAPAPLMEPADAPKRLSATESQGIGQENLFTETCRKSADSQGNTVQCHRSLVNLRCHIMILHNRSCDQLWEEGYVEQVLLRNSSGPWLFPGIHRSHRTLPGMAKE